MQGSPLRAPQQPCCHTVPLRCPRHASPDMPRVRSRADRSDPPRPHAQTPLARRGHAQCTKIGERGERARHTPRQRVLVEVAAHPKRTRPLGGATPHPQQPGAPTVPAHRNPQEGVPLEYSLVTSRARGALLAFHNSPAAASTPARCPRHAAPYMPRARSRADQSDPHRPHAQAPLARRGHAQ